MQLTENESGQGSRPAFALPRDEQTERERDLLGQELPCPVAPFLPLFLLLPRAVEEEEQQGETLLSSRGVFPSVSEEG